MLQMMIQLQGAKTLIYNQQGSQNNVCERVAVPLRVGFASLRAKALKAQKTRMLILLSNRIHGKALWIQLDNVQISSTEIKSSLKIAPAAHLEIKIKIAPAAHLELQMTKNHPTLGRISRACLRHT